MSSLFQIWMLWRGSRRNCQHPVIHPCRRSSLLTSRRMMTPTSTWTSSQLPQICGQRTTTSPQPTSTRASWLQAKSSLPLPPPRHWWSDWFAWSFTSWLKATAKWNPTRMASSILPCHSLASLSPSLPPSTRWPILPVMAPTLLNWLIMSFNFVQYYDTEFTLWDRFEIDGEMTLKEFINHFQVFAFLLSLILSFLIIVSPTHGYIIYEVFSLGKYSNVATLIFVFLFL